MVGRPATKKRGRRDLCSQGFCVVADKNLPAECQCHALWTCFWINYLHLDGNPQKRIRGESGDTLAAVRDYFGEIEEILDLIGLFTLAHTSLQHICQPFIRKLNNLKGQKLESCVCLGVSTNRCDETATAHQDLSSPWLSQQWCIDARPSCNTILTGNEEAAISITASHSVMWILPAGITHTHTHTRNLRHNYHWPSSPLLHFNSSESRCCKRSKINQVAERPSWFSLCWDKISSHEPDLHGQI